MVRGIDQGNYGKNIQSFILHEAYIQDRLSHCVYQAEVTDNYS